MRSRPRSSAIAAIHGCLLGCLILCAVPSSRAQAVDPAPKHTLTNEQLATAFGRLPAAWKVSLSPDGRRAVLVTQPTKIDFPIAVVHEFEGGTSKAVLASVEDEYDLVGCMWANAERLLCRFRGVVARRNLRFGVTRIVAVDADGSDMKVLMEREIKKRLRGTRGLGQFQDRIVDLLPEDPEHVLIQEPGEAGYGLSRLNVYTGKLTRVKRPRDGVGGWIVDGAARPRVRFKGKRRRYVWQHRKPDEPGWHTIYQWRMGDEDDGYQPIGFGDDPNRLILVRRIDGRLALLSEDIVGDGAAEVLFAHDEVDVAGVAELGSHRRIVAATWHTDRPHLTYFDPALERVHAAIRKALPGKAIVIADESWDRDVYIVFAYSDVDPGAWYRLDLGARELSLITAHRPTLTGMPLAVMQPFSHEAADGTSIPGYLTVPGGTAKGPWPTIVLPHGGPESRDVWGFDWLVQFLAARGYAVFQTNYRGSFGYGDDWIGDGAFQEWRRVVSDIDTGLQHLIDEGVTDRDRVCAVGWSYGGYASLLSVLEHPDRYRCVVDIAGVTDPRGLIEHSEGFTNHEMVEEYVSRSAEVLKHGSPLHRVKEFGVPVLIFHPDEDLNVDVEQARDFEKALRKAKKKVEYVEYEDDEHGIWRHASRIDMLERIGAFLEEHLEAKSVPGQATETAPEGSGQVSSR